MNTKDQIKALIQAQDLVRQVWAHALLNSVDKDLRECDLKLSNIINTLGKNNDDNR